MKSKALIATLLAFLLLCTSCGTAPATTTPAPTTPTSTTPAPTTPPDPFAILRTSGEAWITHGLAAYEIKKEPVDLTQFFADPSNMVYLTLYDHMFVYDAEKSIPVAEALFRFIYDTYGADAVLDTEKRIEYKTAYLRSLHLNLSYSQLAEVEQLFTSVAFSSNADYPYIFTFDRATYYFPDFDDGYISQYHGFLYYNTVGLRKMIEYIRTVDKTGLFNTERAFHYYMTFEKVPYSSTSPSGDMKINDSSSALHEAVHAMGIRAGKHIWLSEGLCDYFGKMLGFNDQITAASIQTLMMTEQGYYGATASAEVAKACLARYKEKGGTYASIAEFNFRLMIDSMAVAELETGTYTTLGDAYQAVNVKESTHTGRELSYAQAASLVAYLIDTYGMETVLDAQATQNISAAFGKEYEALKSDWLAYLEGK